jgi:hypothetical protein
MIQIFIYFVPLIFLAIGITSEPDRPPAIHQKTRVLIYSIVNGWLKAQVLLSSNNFYQRKAIMEA